MENNQTTNIGEGDLMPYIFPVEVFPKQIRSIIEVYVKVLNLNADFSAVSILYSFSVALGTHYQLQVKRGWTELACFFIGLVGKPGINKSSPISIFTQPLEKLEKALFKNYLDERSAYLKNRDPKIEKGKNAAIADEPVRKQIIIRDFSMEALLYAEYVNKHGIGIMSDELTSFTKGLNKYRSNGGGGDEEVILSLFSSKPISVNRKSADPIYVEKPFISVIGSIQPQVLIKQFGNDRIDNGLTHRFLFSFPDNVRREDLSDEDIPEHIEEMYQSLVERILIPDFFQSDPYPVQKISLSTDGYDAYKLFRRSINETINNERSEALSGIYAKLDTYSLRIALVLHVMAIACEEPVADRYQISGDTFRKAEKVVRYFEHNALKVFKLMEKFRDPLADYPLESKVIYYKLPTSFTTNTAWEIAKEKVSRRTFFNLLSDEYLFTKLKHGIYEKIW